MKERERNTPARKRPAGAVWPGMRGSVKMCRREEKRMKVKAKGANMLERAEKNSPCAAQLTVACGSH